MQRKLFICFSLLFSTAAMAQVQTTTGTTVDASVTMQTVVPAHLKGLTTETLRPEHSFPVLGQYQVSGTANASVTITLDETNKGIVWVDGLQQGKFKALMKKAPATYKIPAQQTQSGKALPEGTLFLNPESKELTILLGWAYNDADPTSNLTTPSKKKSKTWHYTGVKADAEAMIAPETQQ